MKKLNRTHNAYRNILTGSALKIFQILVPFIVRTVFIYTLGMEYLGLNSLFVSILQVLNLSELGVGSAMVFSMYKPIAEDDGDTICALMNLYRKYYSIIGFVVLTIGLSLLPFLRSLISGNVPTEININVLYLIHLGTTVLSYWLFAYENCLLAAHQRNDVSSVVFLIISVLQYAVQLIVLYVWKNYYYYIIVMPVAQVLTNIITALFAKRIYPQYRAKGKLDSKQTVVINGKIKDLFTSKLGSVVLNSVDSIVISAFLGLSVLAIYNNYYYILSSIIGFMTIILQSITAGIGNGFITESKVKNYSDFRKFSFVFTWLIAVCTCCFVNLYQPFMKLWVGEQNMLSFDVVIMLCIYFYVYEINGLLNTFKDAAGIWHEDRFRPLVVAGTNLALNLILVKIIGIYGIIISTVSSIALIGLPWVTHNLFSYVFNNFSAWKYVKSMFSYTLVTSVACLFSCAITLRMPEGFFYFCIKVLLSVSIPSVLFGTVYRRTEGFFYFKHLVEKVIWRR